ncbi:MAG: hypothetical protein Q8P13_01400 [bacterium]|nr:hypothetical protein [bacterium]
MKYLLLSTIFASICLFLPGKALAASFETEPKEFSLKTNVATSVENQLLLRNLTAQSKSFTLTWLGYQLPKNETLNSTLLTKHSIDFASVNPKTVLLEPFGTDLVTIELSPPDEIRPGDYYGALLIGSLNEAKQVDFTIRILGSVEEKLSVSKVEGDEKKITVSVANPGTQSTNFQLLLEIKKLFGPSKEVKLESLTLKAGQEKTFSLARPSLSPGFYQAFPTLLYADKKLPSTEHASFWVRPWLFGLAGFVTLIFVLLALLKLRGKWSKN